MYREFDAWHEAQLTHARGATQDDFSGKFFRIFEIIIFCLVVAICNIVHAVDTIYGLP